MQMIALEVFVKEGTALGAGGEDGIVAFETAPFGEVVCYVEGCRGRGCVFIIYERDNFDFGRRGVGCGRGLNNYIAGEEVAVAEDKLDGWLGGWISGMLGKRDVRHLYLALECRRVLRLFV